MKHLIITILFIYGSLLSLSAQSITYKEQKNIVYTNSKDLYAQNQCVLDFYYPENKKDYATLVWFHGGGLTSGDRSIPEELKNQGFAIASAGYRFAPNVKVEDIIKDAAQSVVWAYKNFEKN